MAEIAKRNVNMTANRMGIFSLIPMDNKISGAKADGVFIHSNSKLIIRIANGSIPIFEIKLPRKKVSRLTIKLEAFEARYCFFAIAWITIAVKTSARYDVKDKACMARSWELSILDKLLKV